jgi:hypothetical protein
MPFMLQRVGSSEPSEVTESNVRQILRRDYPRQEAFDNVWHKLVAGERIFVSLGSIQYVAMAGDR